MLKNFCNIYNNFTCNNDGVLSGAEVSTSDYQSAGQNLIPDEDRQHTAHPAVHPSKRVGQ